MSTARLHDDLILLLLLRELGGYTAETLAAEPAERVELWLEFIRGETEGQKRDAERKSGKR